MRLNILLASGFLMLTLIFGECYEHTAMTVFHLLLLGSTLVCGYNVGSIIFILFKRYENKKGGF